MSRDDGAAGRPKLTAEQRRVLAEIARMRPTAGNDDGWVHLAGRVPRPTVAALVGSGMIERFRSRHIGPTDQQAHRITSAGRLALTNPEQPQ